MLCSVTLVCTYIPKVISYVLKLINAIPNFMVLDIFVSAAPLASILTRQRDNVTANRAIYTMLERFQMSDT